MCWPAEAAERKAAHADDKAGRSEQEREQKGEAYRQDPLFVYLWERQYGLPGYKAGGLSRWLDGKLARFIGFADARANFKNDSAIWAKQTQKERTNFFLFLMIHFSI